MCPSSSPLSSELHFPNLSVSGVFGSQNQLTMQPRSATFNVQILREKAVSPLQPSISQYPLNADHRQRLGNPDQFAHLYIQPTV